MDTNPSEPAELEELYELEQVFTINIESRQKKGIFILSGFVVNRGKEYLVRILIDLGSSY